MSHLNFREDSNVINARDHLHQKGDFRGTKMYIGRSKRLNDQSLQWRGNAAYDSDAHDAKLLLKARKICHGIPTLRMEPENRESFKESLQKSVSIPHMNCPIQSAVVLTTRRDKVLNGSEVCLLSVQKEVPFK